MARPSSAIISVASGADDVRAEDLAVRLAEDDLHEAFGLADGAGLAAGHERELADLELEALFLRRALGEADAGDLRLAVGAAGEDGRPSSACARSNMPSTACTASKLATCASHGGPMMSPAA